VSKLKITLVKSVIDRPVTQKRVVEALGLKKTNRTKVHNDAPHIRGMINKVKHLLKVEEVNE